MRYKVYGHVTVNVAVEVYANTPEEAMEEAYNQRPGLDVYGGDDNLLGVDAGSETISCDEDITFDSADEIEEDEDDAE